MNKKGFTLVELLVSFVILMITVSTFSGLFKVGKDRMEAAFELSRATYLIQSEMEKLPALPFTSLAAMPVGTFAAGKGQIRIVPITPELLSLQLTFNYSPTASSIKLYTLRSSN